MLETKNNNESQYYFSLKAKSGHILLNSIYFKNQVQRKEAIQKLNDISFTRNNFERKTNIQGQFLFNLKDNDGAIIGRSELYDSEMGMENGIKNLQNRIKTLKKNGNLKFSEDS